MDDPRERTARVLATVEALWAAWEAASPELFDFFTEDASVFASTGSTRLEGRKAYRRFFGTLPRSPELAVQILHTEVRLVGEGALVTSHNRIRMDYRSVDHRTTLLLVPDGEGLKVAHMHMSPLSASAAAEAGTRGLVEDVIQER